MGQEMYVAVGSVDEPLSTIWKLWTHGDEFYAQHLDGSPVYKLSVHSSGQARLAQVDRSGAPAIPLKRDRDPHVIARWELPRLGTTTEPTWFLSIMVPSVFVGPRDTFAGTRFG